MRTATACLFACIITLSRTAGCSPKHTQAPTGYSVSQAGLWGVKPLPFETVRKKANFVVLTPYVDPNRYTLQKSMIAWVRGNQEQTQDGLVTVPARRVVCLIYSVRGKSDVAVIEAKSPSANPRQPIGGMDLNVYQAVGEGYFFAKLLTGAALTTGRARGTDFLIVSLTSDDVSKALESALSAPR